VSLTLLYFPVACRLSGYRIAECVTSLTTNVTETWRQGNTVCWQLCAAAPRSLVFAFVLEQNWHDNDLCIILPQWQQVLFSFVTCVNIIYMYNCIRYGQKKKIVFAPSIGIAHNWLKNVKIYIEIYYLL